MNKRTNAKNWFRLAMKLGLIATDAMVWKTVSDLLIEGPGDVPYALRRSGNSREAIGGPQRRWHASTLITGIGIGIGLGMILAPVSGQRVRGAIRAKATNLRNKVTDVADWAGNLSAQPGRTTGTYAD